MPIYSIIMAAGKGRRMRDSSHNKVCYQIAGTPAINRAIDVYNRLGVVRNVVVVGELAEQVVETIGDRFQNVTFVTQPKQLGTGDAVRCGMRALNNVNDNAWILVVAGDKIIDSKILVRLIEDFDQRGADLSVLVSPARFGGESAGRILMKNDGHPLSIVEMADVCLRACRAELLELVESCPNEALSAYEVQKVLRQHLGAGVTLPQVLEIPDEAASLSRAFIVDKLRRLPIDFTIDADLTFTPAEAENSAFRNESVYLVKKGVLENALQSLHTDNAQDEVYLNEAIIAILGGAYAGSAYRVCTTAAAGPFDIMSYNSPEELQPIGDHFRAEQLSSFEKLRHHLGENRVRTVEKWLQLFPDDSTVMSCTARNGLRQLYGNDQALIEEKGAAFHSAFQLFADQFGCDREAILVRAPGRLNAMGRHVDWQGGRCNLMAVRQEMVAVVSRRDDDLIEVRNVDKEQFPNLTISLANLISIMDWRGWSDVLQCDGLRRHLKESAGGWNLFIEAAILRLQMAHRDQLLCGMDMVVSGDIPVAAGLSSSSAMVVVAAEAVLALNSIDVTPQQFVELCGQGEWYVGTRGGSADHAAIKFGEMGTINHVSFFDFKLLERIEFPDSHTLVVCNSFVKAKKAADALSTFNARVGSYLIGVELVKKRFPQFAPSIRYVRDINPDTLEITSSTIYEILLQMPESMTAREVRKIFEHDVESWDLLSLYFERVSDDAEFAVRGVLWFGISECARSVKAADYLKQGDMTALGHLMNVSHDGERLFVTRPDGRVKPYTVDVSNSALHRVIEMLGSANPDAIERAQLYNQSGSYRCSTEEIDTIIDIARVSPGVAGAQLAGAGLGGCAMVLVETEHVDELEDRLIEQYYAPQGLDSGVLRCTPSAGSCVLSIPS